MLLFCGLPSSRAQLALSHQAWSTEEGLPDASVHQVLQSRVGYVWLATERGAARFDGSSFKVFRHDTEAAFQSDDVSSVAEDAGGALWFGTADGLVELRGASFRRFAEREGLPSSQILQVAAADDGAVFALTAGGLVCLRDEQVRPLPPGLPAIAGIASANNKTVQFFTAGKEVLHYARGVFTAQRSELPGDQPVTGEFTGDGGLRWLHTSHEVYRIMQQMPQRIWPAAATPAPLRITAMLPDGSGKVWIGTNRGLFWLAAGALAAPEAVDPLRGDSVLSLALDREGDLWIGTESSGLHVLRPRAFRSVAAVQGEAVTSVLGADRRSVWLGTRSSGVERLTVSGAQTSVEQTFASLALTSPRVLSLAHGGGGELWIGTPDGLNRISPNGQVKTFTSADGLPDDFVRSLLVDTQGTVWAGTRRGLARLDRSGAIRVLTRADGLPSDSIGPLLGGSPASGELWIGTSTGLALLMGGRIVPVAPQGAQEPGIVTALAADGRGGLWVGVHGQGLFHWGSDRLDRVAAARLPREITALHSDAGGSVWLRAQQAVYRAPAAALLTCAADARQCNLLVDAFGTADGMPSDALAAEGTPQIATGPGGELWFSTLKGVAVTDPAQVPVNRGAPPVVVQRLSVDGVDILLNNKEPRIGPGHSRFVFDYAGLTYRLPSRIRYRYRLDGFDRDWVDAGPARSAVYTGLAPGTYRFRVVAENGNGIWSEPGAELRFRVLPPVYRRWWFALLALLLAGGLVFLALELRARAVRRRFALVLEERNRMAREIHDTLAQDFVSVSLQIDLASSFLRSQRYQEAASQLQTTRALVKEGLTAARQSIWNLRANAGETSLPTRLSALAGRYAFAGKPPQVSIGGVFRPLAPALENEVLRIAGESLSNVDRHAAATRVTVDLRYEPESLLLQVRDDGRGFVPDTARTAEGHYGVRGMYERAAALGAQLRMDSSPEQGTTVTLRVPLRA